MALPAATEVPSRWDFDPWPSAKEVLAAAQTVAGVAKEVYRDELEEVWMFGSRARGDWRPHSDLDLLIVLSGEGRSPGGQWRFLPELRDELVRRFEYITQSMVSLRGSTPEQIRSWDTMFYRSLRRDAIKIL